MAKAKYKEWLTEDGILLLRSFARDGMTDEQIARRMGVNVSTLNRWKKEHFIIGEALNRAKELYDYEVVEALHGMTKGYKVTVKKHFKVKKTEYDPVTGKKKYENEELVCVDDEVYIPPNVTAQAYWLNNRMPEVWRQRPTEPEFNGNRESESGLMRALEDEE